MTNTQLEVQVTDLEGSNLLDKCFEILNKFGVKGRTDAGHDKQFYHYWDPKTGGLLQIRRFPRGHEYAHGEGDRIEINYEDYPVLKAKRISENLFRLEEYAKDYRNGLWIEAIERVHKKMKDVFEMLDHLKSDYMPW